MKLMQKITFQLENVSTFFFLSVRIIINIFRFFFFIFWLQNANTIQLNDE